MGRIIGKKALGGSQGKACVRLVNKEQGVCFWGVRVWLLLRMNDLTTIHVVFVS